VVDNLSVEERTHLLEEHMDLTQVWALEVRKRLLLPELVSWQECPMAGNLAGVLMEPSWTMLAEQALLLVLPFSMQV
jgi:hypothetical protein